MTTPSVNAYNYCHSLDIPNVSVQSLYFANLSLVPRLLSNSLDPVAVLGHYYREGAKVASGWVQGY